MRAHDESWRQIGSILGVSKHPIEQAATYSNSSTALPESKTLLRQP
jgi:hypothetical protein